MTPTYSHYGGFAEGDHVTRDGTDVHLVKDMTDDGYSATFVCVVAPASGWASVGEEEPNLCRRYERVKRNEATGEWEPDPGDVRRQYIDPADMLHIVGKQLIREMVESIALDLSKFAKVWMQGAIGGNGFVKAWRDQIRQPQPRPHYRRNFKRRALRK